MTLIDYTTPYPGGPTFFTGTSAPTDLVPDVYPVALNGRPYMLDLASGRFARAFEARLRDSTDDSNIPGEAAINPQGLWRRSQTSWHKGEGQQYGDTAEGLDTRFYTSKNIDPWTRGQLSLLPTTESVYSSASTNLRMVRAGDYLYVADGQDLKRTSDLSTFTTITTGAVAANITAICSDGYNVYLGYAGDGIHTTDAGGATISHYVGGTETYDALDYVKGRLMAGHDNHVHNFTASSPSSHPAATHEFTNTDTSIVGYGAGQNHIYVATNSGKRALIYRMQIKDDATGLDVPVQAGELPRGETLHAIHGYLSYIILGTSNGVRVCTSDSNGDLVIGPTLETSSSVKCAIGDSRFVWFGWSNFEASGATGLGRLDLSELVGVNEPAYASDLMASTTGDVVDVENWDGRRLFVVEGAGIYQEHATDLAPEGYVDTGTWRWGIPDRKFAAFFDMRSEPLNGTLTFAHNFDNAGFTSLAAFDRAGATENILDGPTTAFGEARIKITFTRSASDNTLGPVLTRWQVRSVPAPRRSELFSVPLMLHEKLRMRNREFHTDVNNELFLIRDLVKDARIVTYQEGLDTYKVIVENVEWSPVDTTNADGTFNGTCVVTLRSLVA